ncbi:hypothetical protein ACHAXN_010230 [Cyclotella atomus]
MDEESRLREELTKKKLINKQLKRKQSGEMDEAASGGSPSAKDKKDDRRSNGRDKDRDGDKKNEKERNGDKNEKERNGDSNKGGEKRRRRRKRPRREDRRGGDYHYNAPPRDNRDYYSSGYGNTRGDSYYNNRNRRDPPRWRPPPGRGRDNYDNYPRGRGRSFSRSVSYSRSRSNSRGRRYSSDEDDSRSSYSSRSRSLSRGRSYSRSPDTKKRSPSPPEPEVDQSTKDVRTIFVSSLVMKATESDIRRYFRKYLGGPKWSVREVILLRDRRTGRHKGGCYVELATLGLVDKALGANGVVPDFQRFPISVKRSEAEKNDFGPLVCNVSGGNVQYTADGRKIEAQKVYVGSIEQGVTQAQLYALFEGFGALEKVLLQTDTTTGISKGFAFLSYKDPKDANLAIQTMSGQLVAGQALKTGWANLQSAAAGVEEIRSNDFPPDADEKIKKVNATLVELTGSGLATLNGAPVTAASLGVLPTSQLQSVAEAALEAALGGAAATLPIPAAIAQPAPAATQPTIASIYAPAPAAVDAKIVGRLDNPSKHILVHNMFDKDEETDQGWDNDIRLDFEDECQQYGKISSVIVMSKDPGGKIYATFETVDGAMNCAKSLAGRWFDKRQLRVEFVDDVPSSA